MIEIDSRSAVITWSVPYSGNSPIVSYHVEFRQTASNDISMSEWEDTTKATSSSSSSHSQLASVTNTKGMVVVDISSLPGGTIFRETLPGTEASFTLRGLKPMTSYEVRVQAENKLGLSGFAGALKIITKEECEFLFQAFRICDHSRCVCSTIGSAAEYSRLSSKCSSPASYLPTSACRSSKRSNSWILCWLQSTGNG